MFRFRDHVSWWTPATQNCRLPTLQKPHWFELICVFFFSCVFFNHKVFSTTFGRVLNDEIRGSFPPFLGGIGVGLVECMLWTPFNLGILLAPQPWDGWIYLQPESLLVTSYHQVFLQFFLPFSDSSQEGGFFFGKNRFIKEQVLIFFHRMFAKNRGEAGSRSGSRGFQLSDGMWWHSWQVFFGGEGAKVKFFFWHSVLVSFQPGLRVFDLIRSLMFFLPIDL